VRARARERWRNTESVGGWVREGKSDRESERAGEKDSECLQEREREWKRDRRGRRECVYKSEIEFVCGCVWM